MSMYNMLFGMNPASGLLIQALGLDGEAPQNWNERFEKLTNDWGEIDLYSENAQQLMAEAKEMGYYPTSICHHTFSCTWVEDATAICTSTIHAF